MRDTHSDYQRLFARVLLAHIRDFFFYFGVYRDQHIINVAVIRLDQSFGILLRKFPIWPKIHYRWFCLNLTLHFFLLPIISEAERLMKRWVNKRLFYLLVSIRLSDHPVSELCVLFLQLSSIIFETPWATILYADL
jgi:hypothetical protein